MMSSQFAYIWLVVVWLFQGLGFVRAYTSSREGESMWARNVAFLIHLITLVALLNVKV